MLNELAEGRMAVSLPFPSHLLFCLQKKEAYNLVNCCYCGPLAWHIAFIARGQGK